MSTHMQKANAKALCDVVLNALKNVVKFSPAHKKKIARHKTHLRLLANKETSLSKIRIVLIKKVLIQKGNGFLTSVVGLGLFKKHGWSMT